MKDYPKALSYADTAINTANGLSLDEQIGKEIPDTYRIRGEIHYELKNYTQAIQDFTSAIELEPKLKSAYLNRGYVYNEQGEYLKATQDFKTVGDLYADDAIVLNNIAWFYATCKDKQYRDGPLAVKFSEKAANLEASTHNLDTLGAAYVENKQYEKAIDEYKSVVIRDSAFIERYQKSLNEKGCYPGPIDGIYSQEFEKALRNCVLQGNYL